MENVVHHESIVKTWVVVILLLGWILFKGGLAYFMIGDPGMPEWDYRPVKDVPGESPYAMYETLPYVQHVQEENSESYKTLPYYQTVQGEKGE